MRRSLLGKLFLLLLSAAVGTPALSEPPIEMRVRSFADVDNTLLFKRRSPLPPHPIGSSADFILNTPQHILLLIDIDDTTLTGGREKAPARPLAASTYLYIKRWKDHGFHLAFLTSRKESERLSTRKDLAEAGINDPSIPLLITNGTLKGPWLEKNPSWQENGKEFVLSSPQITTVVLMDNSKHQLDSLHETICKEKSCYLVHFGQAPDLSWGEARELPDSLEGFSEESTEAGGTRSTFYLTKAGDRKFVLKKPQENRLEQFKEELLADGLYQAIGKDQADFAIAVPPFKILRQNGRLMRVSRYLVGAPLGFAKETTVARGFIVDAFLANWDLVEGGKNFWLSDNSIYRMDNGGALRYRALGEQKASRGYSFADASCDLDTMRGFNCPSAPQLAANMDGARFYQQLTAEEISSQIEKLLPLKALIIKTAEHYQQLLELQNFPELKANLVTRLESLQRYYHQHPHRLSSYQSAPPFRRVIPGRSSASILLYSRENGIAKVLLGKRIGHTWWGNLGGKSDNQDRTLMNTALREVAEESMGIYQLSSEDLLASPSHDLISDSLGADAVHRMYLHEVPLVSREDLQEKLREYAQRGETEYIDFAWIPVDDVLRLVKANLSVANQASNEIQYQVPLRPSPHQPLEVAIHHPLMDMLRQQPVLAWLEALQSPEPSAARPTSAATRIAKIARRNTQGSTGITPGIAIKDFPAPPVADPDAQELEYLYYTMTRHKDLMTEIQEQPRNKASKTPASSLPQAAAADSTALPVLTASEAFLQFNLGEDFVAKDDRANIYRFLKTKSPLSRDYAEEFAPFPHSCAQGAPNSYRCVLLRAMAEERRMHDWLVFYHALPGKMAFIYDIASEFRALLGMKKNSPGTISTLRAFDTFFKGLETVEDFVGDELTLQKINEFTGINNYAGKFQERGLSTNVFLFGNPETDTSSTFHLLHQNKTVKPPDYQGLLAHILAQFGGNDTRKYFALFGKYFAASRLSAEEHEGSTLPIEHDENQLLQIFISPHAVDDLVYLSGSGGHGLFPSYEAQIKEFSPLKFLTRLRSSPGDADKILESTALSSNGLNHLQARIFVKPRLMGDNSRVQIKRYFKTPCAAAYFTELRHLVREDVSQWIQNRYSLAPDTLENPEASPGDEALPPLQKVLRHQQQSQGKTYQSRSPESMYGTFLVNDDVAGVLRILAINPNFDVLQKVQNPNYQGLFLPTNALVLMGAKVFSLLIKRNPDLLKIASRTFYTTGHESELILKVLELYAQQVAADQKLDEAFDCAFLVLSADLIFDEQQKKALGLMSAILVKQKKYGYERLLQEIAKESKSGEQINTRFAPVLFFMIETAHLYSSNPEGDYNLAFAYVKQRPAEFLTEMDFKILFRLLGEKQFSAEITLQFKSYLAKIYEHLINKPQVDLSFRNIVFFNDLLQRIRIPIIGNLVYSIDFDFTALSLQSETMSFDNKKLFLSLLINVESFIHYFCGSGKNGENIAASKFLLAMTAAPFLNKNPQYKEYWLRSMSLLADNYLSIVMNQIPANLTPLIIDLARAGMKKNMGQWLEIQTSLLRQDKGLELASMIVKERIFSPNIEEQWIKLMRELYLSYARNITAHGWRNFSLQAMALELTDSSSMWVHPRVITAYSQLVRVLLAQGVNQSAAATYLLDKPEISDQEAAEIFTRVLPFYLQPLEQSPGDPSWTSQVFSMMTNGLKRNFPRDSLDRLADKLCANKDASRSFLEYVQAELFLERMSVEDGVYFLAFLAKNAPGRELLLDYVNEIEAPDSLASSKLRQAMAPLIASVQQQLLTKAAPLSSEETSYLLRKMVNDASELSSYLELGHRLLRGGQGDKVVDLLFSSANSPLLRTIPEPRQKGAALYVLLLQEYPFSDKQHEIIIKRLESNRELAKILNQEMVSLIHGGHIHQNNYPLVVKIALSEYRASDGTGELLIALLGKNVAFLESLSIIKNFHAFSGQGEKKFLRLLDVLLHHEQGQHHLDELITAMEYHTSAMSQIAAYLNSLAPRTLGIQAATITTLLAPLRSTIAPRDEANILLIKALLRHHVGVEQVFDKIQTELFDGIATSATRTYIGLVSAIFDLGLKHHEFVALAAGLVSDSENGERVPQAGIKLFIFLLRHGQGLGEARSLLGHDRDGKLKAAVDAAEGTKLRRQGG